MVNGYLIHSALLQSAGSQHGTTGGGGGGGGGREGEGLVF